MVEGAEPAGTPSSDGGGTGSPASTGEAVAVGDAEAAMGRAAAWLSNLFPLWVRGASPAQPAGAPGRDALRRASKRGVRCRRL